MKFGKISDISLHEPETYKDTCFLTFDIDWCSDEVLADTIDIIEERDVCATWFVTHSTPILDRLRENPKFELGIHPNFNPLLRGHSSPLCSVSDVADYILNIVPDARSMRSHSVVQSSWIWDLFSKKGITYDCNDFIYYKSDINLKPWSLWNGMVKVPYLWEDDVVCLYKDDLNPAAALVSDGLRVFDFHPIHVFLNSEDLARYERTRDVHLVHQDLLHHRCADAYGVRDALRDLLVVKK